MKTDSEVPSIVCTTWNKSTCENNFICNKLCTNKTNRFYFKEQWEIQLYEQRAIQPYLLEKCFNVDKIENIKKSKNGKVLILFICCWF